MDALVGVRTPLLLIGEVGLVEYRYFVGPAFGAAAWLSGERKRLTEWFPGSGSLVYWRGVMHGLAMSIV